MIVKDLAGECLAVRDKITSLDSQIAEVLENHSDAALIATLPGMGAVLTAELLAVAGGLSRFTSGDHLAAAAGLAPALVQSGKVRYLQRPLTGDRALKRVFYQSAFCALPRDPASTAFYDRKRAEANATTKRSSRWPDGASTSSTACSAIGNPTKHELPKWLDRSISLSPPCSAGRTKDRG